MHEALDELRACGKGKEKGRKGNKGRKGKRAREGGREGGSERGGGRHLTEENPRAQIRELTCLGDKEK
jgi:hypothetical protein